MVCGEPATLDALAVELEREGVRVRRIAVDYASHSAYVEAIEDDVLAALAPITPGAPVVPFGPDRLLRSLAEAYVHGLPVDLADCFPDASPVDLPTYAFQRRRHWLPELDAAAPASVAHQAAHSGAPANAVPAEPGEESAVPDEEPSLRTELAATDPAARLRRVLRLVCAATAVVLGFDGPGAVDPAVTFKNLGVESTTALELRSRLQSATGLRLPATLVYERPTPRAVADHLLAELTEPAPADRPGVASGAPSDDDPIVVVGMGCRYPGGVESPEDLWRLVATGTDAVGAFPDDRGWDLDGVYDPEPGKPGKSYVREGGFLYGAAEFDAAFFGISPREAVAMDPQQRLLLETSWASTRPARPPWSPSTWRSSPCGAASPRSPSRAASA
nr:beta-ketoacyl synthase N-terminal-like domain-containing protein [Streptomyces globisporus]